MKHASTLPPLPPSLKGGLLATLILFVALLAINQPLITAAAPKGIIDLQLASTAEHTEEILLSWGDGGLVWARTSLWLDLVFIAVYLGSLLTLTSYLLQDRPGIRERKLGHMVRALFVAAGLSDLIENALLLGNLADPSDSVSLYATICALIKFTTLLIGATGLIVIRAERRHPLNS